MDINWRVTDDGLLIGALHDGTETTMMYLNQEVSSRATTKGGAIQRAAHEGFRTINVGIGPSRWGRNNVRKNVNYGITDTDAGLRDIQRRSDEAIETLKRKLTLMLGDDTPSFLSQARYRGLVKLAEEIRGSYPEAADIIDEWKQKDGDMRRVYSKANALLTGRTMKAYEQLCVVICRELTAKKVSRIVIEKAILKKVAANEKKNQPVALQKSARYRQSAGLSIFVQKLKQIAPKHGKTVVEREAAYTTQNHFNCGQTIDFGHLRRKQCSRCGEVVDQDDNAAKNLRAADLDAGTGTVEEVKGVSPDAITWEFSVARVAINGEIKQKRKVVIVVEPQKDEKPVAS